MYIFCAYLITSNKTSKALQILMYRTFSVITKQWCFLDIKKWTAGLKPMTNDTASSHHRLAIRSHSSYRSYLPTSSSQASLYHRDAAKIKTSPLFDSLLVFTISTKNEEKGKACFFSLVSKKVLKADWIQRF